MTLAGAFTPTARAAILGMGDGRCCGCGAPNPTCQHRRGRRMGGTSNTAIGHPANGVPLCGDGVRGCHGWTEHHPADATLLGWRLAPGEDPLEAPFWTRYGWRRWTIETLEVHTMTSVEPVDTITATGLAYVDELEDLDHRTARLDALGRYLAALP